MNQNGCLPLQTYLYVVLLSDQGYGYTNEQLLSGDVSLPQQAEQTKVLPKLSTASQTAMLHHF